jgi:hypothetical protein
MSEPNLSRPVRYLSLPEAARRTGIGLGQLRRARRAGALPTYHVGSAWPRVRWDELLDWIASTRETPESRERLRSRHPRSAQARV